MVNNFSNQSLSDAKAAKKDEFYTQYIDIHNEIEAYLDFDPDTFRGKIVYCNCDDPFESNFFKFFAANFNKLGLKRLITTSYDGSPKAGRGILFENYIANKGKCSKPKALAITLEQVKDEDGSGTVDINDVKVFLKRNKSKHTALTGDDTYAGGDFRSNECIAFLKEADIVVTNPPFSLFRDYVAQLVEYGKKFLIIGNMNAVTYKEIFPLFQTNQMWYGPSIRSGDREFRVPPNYPMTAAGSRVDEYGNKYVRVKGVRWFTNLDFEARYKKLGLQRTYSPDAYPKYANFDAIEVGRTKDIPLNYDGPMGVPISFLDKYNPEQFDILGSSMALSQPMSQIARKGTYQQGGPRFYLPNSDGTYRRMYDRIVIKTKHS